MWSQPYGIIQIIGTLKLQLPCSHGSISVIDLILNLELESLSVSCNKRIIFLYSTRHWRSCICLLLRLVHLGRPRPAEPWPHHKGRSSRVGPRNPALKINMYQNINFLGPWPTIDVRPAWFQKNHRPYILEGRLSTNLTLSALYLEVPYSIYMFSSLSR